MLRRRKFAMAMVVVGDVCTKYHGHILYCQQIIVLFCNSDLPEAMSFIVAMAMVVW